MYWMTGGHPPKGLLLPTDIEPTPPQNSVSKVAGLHLAQRNAQTKKNAITLEYLLQWDCFFQDFRYVWA